MSRELKDNAHRSTLPVVIVTGCASGIGSEIIKLLYKRNDLCVIATARAKSVHKIKSVFAEKPNFKIRVLDVNSDENIYSLIQEITEQLGRVDVIINNAALCFRSVLEHMDIESELAQLKTNYLGPMTLTKAVLPIMREQGFGHIINISSVSGLLAMPTMGSYSASKHALEGASEALWYEAKPFGIKVNLVQLGFVNSNSFENVILTPKAALSVQLNGPHSEYYNSMTPMIEKMMSYSLDSSTKVAKKIVGLIDKPANHLRVTLTLDATAFNIIKRIIPARFLQKILYFFLPNSIRWGGRWKAT